MYSLKSVLVPLVKLFWTIYWACLLLSLVRSLGGFKIKACAVQAVRWAKAIEPRLSPFLPEGMVLFWLKCKKKNVLLSVNMRAGLNEKELI